MKYLLFFLVFISNIAYSQDKYAKYLPYGWEVTFSNGMDSLILRVNKTKIVYHLSDEIQLLEVITPKESGIFTFIEEELKWDANCLHPVATGWKTYKHQGDKYQISVCYGEIPRRGYEIVAIEIFNLRSNYRDILYTTLSSNNLPLYWHQHIHKDAALFPLTNNKP